MRAQMNKERVQAARARSRSEKQAGAAAGARKHVLLLLPTFSLMPLRRASCCGVFRRPLPDAV